MNTDSLTLSPETAAALLPDCQPGEEKEVTLKITVGTNDEEGLTATVSSGGYDEEAEEAPAEEPVAPPAPMMKRPAAVAAVMGKKKP